MTKQKILYAINLEDVKNVARKLKMRFKEEDIDFLQDKIGDFFGSQWYDAVEYALKELKKDK